MIKFRSVFLFFLTATLVACRYNTPNNQVANDELYISLPATDSIVLIDPQQQREVIRFQPGKLPHNMRLSADGSKLYVVLVGSQAVAEIDVLSRRLLRTMLTENVPMQDTEGNAIVAHTEREAHLHNNCFDCHNGLSDGAKPAVVGSRPFGLALTENNQLLVANSRSASVVFIDLASGEIVKTWSIEAAGDAVEPTELAIMDHRLYVTIRPVLPSDSPAVLRAYDLNSGALLSQTDAGSAVADLYPDIKNQLLYTSNFNSNTLDQFGKDLQHQQQYTVGNGPFGLYLNEQQLTVADYYNNSVSKIDLLNQKIQSRVLQLDTQLFANPTHLASSTHSEKLYVLSGGTTGYLLTLDKQSLEVVDYLKIDALPFDVININTESVQN